MMLVVGTVTIRDMPLTIGKVTADGECLVISDRRIPCTQGTGAMISAALATTSYLGLDPPYALLVGDIGEGKGSRQLYQYLIDHIVELSPAVLTCYDRGCRVDVLGESSGIGRGFRHFYP